MFAAILFLVTLWAEVFPTAHGQNEGELRSTAVGRLTPPAGAHLIAHRFEAARWIGQGFSLLGELPQVYCARVTDQYLASDPATVVAAAYASARAAGFAVDDPPATVPSGGVSFDQGTTVVHLYVSGSEGPGSKVTIVVVDLPEPLGGHCTGGRLGIYRTVVSY